MATYTKASLSGQGEPWGITRGGLNPRPGKRQPDDLARHAARMVTAEFVVLPIREGRRLGLRLYDGMTATDVRDCDHYHGMLPASGLVDNARGLPDDSNALARFRPSEAMRTAWQLIAGQANEYVQERAC